MPKVPYGYDKQFLAKASDAFEAPAASGSSERDRRSEVTFYPGVGEVEVHAARSDEGRSVVGAIDGDGDHFVDGQAAGDGDAIEAPSLLAFCFATSRTALLTSSSLSPKAFRNFLTWSSFSFTDSIILAACYASRLSSSERPNRGRSPTRWDRASTSRAPAPDDLARREQKRCYLTCSRPLSRQHFWPR